MIQINLYGKFNYHSISIVTEISTKDTDDFIQFLAARYAAKRNTPKSKKRGIRKSPLINAFKNHKEPL